MSQENVEVVLAQFENANARNFDAVTDAWADDVVVVPHGKTRSVTGEGAIGKEAVGEWFGGWFGTFEDDYRFDIEETRDLGDRVFVAASHHGHGRASGAPVTGWGVWIYTVLRGKIVRCDFYDDRSEGLEAVELRE